MTQTGTQTSPKIFPKIAISIKPDSNLVKSQEPITFNRVNVNLHGDTRKTSESEALDPKEAKKLEPDRVSRSFDDYTYEGMDSDDDLPSGIDDGSSEEEHNGSVIESPSYDKCKAAKDAKQCVQQIDKDPLPSTSQNEGGRESKIEGEEKLQFDFSHELSDLDDTSGIKGCSDWEKYYCVKDSK